ncbi:MAG: CpaD family pilus assembly protein [Parvibaculum sedimenti]|uniref:CpaD family pilus assembly protein n=1 Tax=Parvibaculum sedimenti TaxID=2608632 RepID=UPI003BB7D9F5
MSHMPSFRIALRLLPVALAFSVAGCAGGFNGAEMANQEPEYRHPISVDRDVPTLTVPAPRAKSGLTDQERREVAAFAAAYKERGHGALTVSTPSGSANTTTAMNVLVDIRDTLSDKGVATDAVSYTSYRASAANADAPIILSYSRYVATPSACGDWSTNYAYDPANVAPPNFGCASQNNLAVLVADPGDFVTPRDSTPRDAQRSTEVLSKYRKGEITATKRDEHDSAAVSEVSK